MFQKKIVFKTFIKTNTYLSVSQIQSIKHQLYQNVLLPAFGGELASFKNENLLETDLIFHNTVSRHFLGADFVEDFDY